jgi:hypothetical protein
MTDAELDALARVCNAASEGPWGVTRVDEEGCQLFAVTAGERGVVCMLDEDERGSFDDESEAAVAADFALIAAARAALPALIAEVRRLRADTPIQTG